MRTKICGHCKVEKKISEFSRDKGNKDGCEHKCKECIKKYRLNHVPKKKDISPAERLQYRLKKDYGISIWDYLHILQKQNYVCAICGKKETTIYSKTNAVMILSVDHDHVTGRVRGLLCKKCNLGVGCFNDDPKIIRMAEKYLASC